MSLSHKNLNPDAPIHQRVPKVHQAKVETPDGDFNTPFQRLKGRRLTTRLSSLIPLSSYEPSTRSRFKLHFAITTERLLTKTTKTSVFLQSRRFITGFVPRIKKEFQSIPALCVALSGLNPLNLLKKRLYMGKSEHWSPPTS